MLHGAAQLGDRRVAFYVQDADPMQTVGQETRYSCLIVRGDDNQTFLVVTFRDVPIAEKIILDASGFLCRKHAADSR
jgi:hypothetical protein